MPYHVKEKKIEGLIKRFGKDSSLIRRMVQEAQFAATVRDPIIIEDPLINIFVETLLKKYKKLKTEVHRVLDQYGIEGYRENLETLLNPDVLDRLRKVYGLDESTIQYLQVAIVNYILIQHIEKWFLYSNRSELSRSILSAQIDVENWLSYEGKKLSKLVEVVKSEINNIGRSTFSRNTYPPLS